jgi:uncharacterized protein
MIPTNATIIRKAYDDFANGNIPAVLEAFDKSITWHVPGHSPLSGDYKGHDEVVGFFKHTLALCGGIWLVLVVVGLRTEDRVPEPEAVRSGGALRELTKEVPEIHALLTRSPFGGDILRR